MSFLPPPLLRSAQSCLRPSYRPCAHRALSYSLIVHSQKQSPAESAKSAPSEDVEEGEKEQEKEKEKEKEEEGSVDESSKITTYSEFLQKIAEPFKTASTPRNWLGQDTPFPMNESFKPPPPLSDAQREHMYKLYMLDPTANSVRALSERFHLSLKRVDAILRLKGMEHAWKKEGKTLQTGFVVGMERILGVPPFKSESEPNWERANVDAADSLEEIEKRDAARNRYQRLYWETVAEHGGEPILPARLEHSKKLAIRMAEISKQKKDQAYLPSIPDTDTIKTPKEPVQLAVREGRPTVQFVDVGTKFLDPVTEEKRLAKKDRRVRQRTKKLEEKKLLRQ